MACQSEAQDFCGAGGVCAGLSADTIACSTACVPGQCEDVCQGEEVCVPLQGENGEASEFGACVVPPTGEQQAYDLCGQESGLCAAGLQCLIFTQGETEGMCMPECTNGEACPERGGVAGQCALGIQGGDQMFCGLLCDAAGDGTTEGCPDEMVCVVSGGNPMGLCTWQ